MASRNVHFDQHLEFIPSTTVAARTPQKVS
jgi:hypothetical protein